MIRTTPFHARLSELNTQGLYTHWQGHLSALRYTHAPKHEYFAVRNARRRLRHLAPVQVPHPRTRRRAVPRRRAGPRHPHLPARAGAVHAVVRRPRLRDGGRRRVPALRDRLPAHRGAARPRLVRRPRAAGCGSSSRTSPTTTASSPSRARGRGPCSRALMPEADSLAYFEHAQAKVGSAPVTLSRTGYTGDLGFEVTVEAEHAVDVLDAVLEAGRGHGIRPFGEEALMMLRIEAGLPLSTSSGTTAGSPSPTTSGSRPRSSAWAGCCAASRDGDRAFVGGDGDPPRAGRRDRRAGPPSASSSTGRTGTGCTATPGCCRPRTSTRCPTSRCCTTGRRRTAARRSATSPASCTPPCCSGTSAWPGCDPTSPRPGTEVHLELALNHHNTTVLARTAKLPLFNPARKTAKP